MDIRAHHILCKKYFNGEGYNKEFVDNFKQVIEDLKSNPLIKVINSTDIICSSCPHKVNNKCIRKGPDSETKVREKDNKIIEIIGITQNQKIKAEDADNLANLKLKELKKTCKDCEWKQYCN